MSSKRQSIVTITGGFPVNNETESIAVTKGVKEVIEHNAEELGLTDSKFVKRLVMGYSLLSEYEKERLMRKSKHFVK